MLQMLSSTSTLPDIITPFDYSELEPCDAQEAQAAATRITARNRAAVIETGLDLLNIKERLRGRFVKWLDAEFGMTPRTAQNYMLAASAFHDKCETVSYLPPKILYELASHSTPPEVREEVLQRLEAGEKIKVASLADMVRTARRDHRRQKRAECDATASATESRTLAHRNEPIAAQKEAEDTALQAPVAEVRQRAADFIVRQLGEKLADLLGILGEHASLRHADLVAAATRASEASRTASSRSATSPVMPDPLEIPPCLDRRTVRT